MALMPKRVKFRKSQRGRIRGLATRGNTVEFGEYGLQALEPHWLDAKCIEAGRVIGASDKYAEDPVSEGITPLMVGTTISELAGMDTQARAEFRVLDGGSVIHELV